MNKFLFNEFPEVSSKEWKQKIQADLKGADYNETLIWKNIETIDVKPFYHQDEFETKFVAIPNHPKSTAVAQNFFIDNPTITNKLMIDAINRGAEAIIISADKEFDTSVVFRDFPFQKCPIYLNFTFLSETFILELQKFFSEKKATVFFNIDIIGNLARTGNWFYNLKKDHQILETILTKEPFNNTLSIDTSLFQNAGATIIQQLAYSLGQANEYLHHYASHFQTKSEERNNSITFKVSVGTNYFFEIAKIRSLRKLYAVLAKEYNVPTHCHILATPTKRNKTLYDYNVNMLRTTTEYMSAFLGGADSICSLAYDAIYHKTNEFGERIARNQLLILKQESYFNPKNNPAEGAYYIESLTEQLSEKALSLFKNIEKNGGFSKQLKEGIIQRKIKESANKEQELFDEGKLLLLGTNIHTNPNDNVKNNLELYPFVKTNIRKTLIEPIIEKRISEKLEQERLKTE